MLNQFSRTQLLYGQDNMRRLAASRVAVFGIGGVGGYVVEVSGYFFSISGLPAPLRRMPFSEVYSSVYSFHCSGLFILSEIPDLTVL